MFSSYSAAAFAPRAAKSSLHAHSSYTYSYLPSHYCPCDDAVEHRRHHHHVVITQIPYITPRLLQDGCLIRQSAHLLLLSARLRPPLPPHPHTPRCCRRQAAARSCCYGGGGRPVAGQVSWQVEARGRRCCGRGAGRPDLGAVCRGLKAPKCRCDSSGGGRLLGVDFGRRDVLRLVGRAVRQEVWEYDGGQWPCRWCSIECHDDWEEEEEDSSYGRWEVAGGARFGRGWEEEDDDVNEGYGCCRDCRRRKGLESYYSGDDAYSGRRRERRDVDEDHRRFRVSDPRGWQQREYHDYEDDLDLRRGRQRWEGRDRRDFDFEDAVETRNVETRRYQDDGREYGCRKERGNFYSNDMADARRASQYAEDVGRFDDRRESRGFEIDDKVDVRREGMCYSNDDHKYVSRHKMSEDTDGDDVSLLRSHCWNDKEIDYDEQDLAERRYYSGVRSKKSARASSLHEDDSKRASSSKCTVDAMHIIQDSRVRWHDNADRQTEQKSEERNRQNSVGWSNDERETYDYDDAVFVRVRDSRIGTKDVKVITEDETRLVCSSKNTSILKHSSNADHQAVVHNDESRKSTQRITEMSKVHDNNVSRSLVSLTGSRNNSENLTNVTTDESRKSAQRITEMSKVHDNNVSRNLVSLTGSRNNSENLTNVTTDNSRNVSRASHSLITYDKVNQMDIDDRPNSLQNITHVIRDKKRIVNQQVIHETDIDVQNIGHVDVSKIHGTDISTSRRSQSQLETRSDVNSSGMSFINSTRSQEKEVYRNRFSASDSALARGSHSHLETGLYDQFHSTSSINIDDKARGSQEQVELNITNASNAVVASNAKSSQDSRDRMVRSEDTHRNMDLIVQHTDTSGISDEKDITGLLVESTEEGLSMVNAKAQQVAMMGSNDQEVMSETTAVSIPSGSSARKSVKESILESAARLEKSSTFHVGQFVDELQKGVSDADTASTNRNEKSIATASGYRMKGPADEMWDVQSTTSQETFKTADKEEGYSGDGATNSPSQTPKIESTLARKVHKSLWAYVSDIIRLGWIHRGDSHDSSHKSVKRSLSNNSQSTEGWLSGQEHDNDGTGKKNGCTITNAKHQKLINSHSEKSESGMASMSKEECLPTGTQCLQISETIIEPEAGRSEGDLLARSSTGDLHISGERMKQSDAGESPKGNCVDDGTPTMVDVMVRHLPEHRTATLSRIVTKGSSKCNTGKEMLADGSSVTISATEGGNGDGADWLYDPSSAITPYNHPQTQAATPHENTSTGILDPPELPVGSSVRFEEKNVVQEAPGVIKTMGKDAELKRRMFQRNKQVLKETFDEWEEAYQHDAEQRKADELFMREALLEAQRAADIWEVPVGAVLVQNGEIIARGCNLVEDLRDSTAHAEIVCIREASNKLKTWRLADTTLYVTLEPCAMCAGAILQARINTVVWGAPNKLLGADGSWVRLFPGDGQTSTLESGNQGQAVGPVHPFHPKISIRRGVLSAKCSEIMQQFFQLRRRKKQKTQSPPRLQHQEHHHPVKFFSKMHHVFGTIFCL